MHTKFQTSKSFPSLKIYVGVVIVIVFVIVIVIMIVIVIVIVIVVVVTGKTKSTPSLGFRLSLEFDKNVLKIKKV